MSESYNILYNVTSIPRIVILDQYDSSQPSIYLTTKSAKITF